MNKIINRCGAIITLEVEKITTNFSQISSFMFPVIK